MWLCTVLSLFCNFVVLWLIVIHKNASLLYLLCKIKSVRLYQEDFIWRDIWRTSIHLLKVRWSGHLVSYFPLMYRSSRPELFCKNGVLRNLTRFTGKHLCQGLFFNKVAGLRTPFYTEHLWWLLLDIHFGINAYYIAFNIFSCRILIISYKMLMITGISIEKINQLIMYTIISRNVTIFYRQNWLPYFKCKKNWRRARIQNETFRVALSMQMTDM